MGSSLSTDTDLGGDEKDLVLNRKEVSKWTKDDVQNWLEQNNFSQYKDAFKKEEIDGEALLLLNEEQLKQLGVSVGNAAKILQRVRIINTQTGEDEPTTSNTTTKSTKNEKPLKKKDSVGKKKVTKGEEEKLIGLGMKKLEKLKGLQNLSLEQRKDKARNLVVKDALLASYLNSDYVATRKTMINLLESTEATQGSTGMPLQSTSQVAPNQTMEEEEDKEHIRTIMKQIDVIEGRGQTGQLQQQELQSVRNPIPVEPAQKSQLSVTNEEYLKVKLVIVEIHNSASQRTFRRVLSPLMDTFNISPQFGLFHSALIVGPWYLEWNDSCLVVPRKCYSGAAILAADVQKYFQGPQVSVALDKISEVICEWNANYQYSQQKYNCQLFVDELCKVLDIQLNYGGALGTFLGQLRKTGQCELQYTISPDLQNKLGVTESVKQFKTHKELDEFVQLVINKAPTYFEMDSAGKDDWVLLKSYDRAFWLRHFKNKKDESFEPCQSCPFRNPTESGSIIDNFFTYKKKK